MKRYEDIFVHSPMEMAKEDSRLISSYGRGQRKRTDVSYNCEEDMDDEEWMTVGCRNYHPN